MDWNFKTNSGYLSEFDQESISNICPIDGSSVSFESPGSRSTGEFSFDLKLGQVGNKTGSRTMNKWNDAAGAKSGSSSASGSSKRARGSGNGNQTAFCLVDGCNSDLSNCREYHRRHKVCEVHSKTPVVTINGQRQRFCQQCSRFHALEEFDEGKRSCRKRLDGHNRRRRKPQPDLISRPSDFFSSSPGTKLLQFSSSHVFPSTNVVSPSWVGGNINPTVGTVSFSQERKSNLIFPASSQSSGGGYKVEKPFPFLQDGTHQRSYSSLSGGDSDCALSLLSSPSQSQSSNNVRLSHQNVLVQPLPLGSEPVDSGNNNVVGYGSSLFQNGSVSDGSVVSGNETAPQTFPFHWE